MAIVGKAPSSLKLAPYDDQSWEIWTLSDLVQCGQAPRSDCHFELHDLDVLDGQPQRKDYSDWLAAYKGKTLLCKTDARVPAGVAYPLNEVTTRFGRYFTNSVSWMIALAIFEGVNEIGIFGVDMAQDGTVNGEYAKQRPSCEYFVGVAIGAGIKVTIPAEAQLLKSRGLYGFEIDGTQMEQKCKARCTELQGRINQAVGKRDAAAQEASYLQGALEGMGWMGQWA